MNLIVAMDLSGGIGKDGSIPWKCSEDMKNFKRVTSGNVVVMGRKTWESIGSKPLPGRVNIVLTSRLGNDIMGSVYFLSSIQQVIIWHMLHQESSIFIIGGARLYKEFTKRGLVNRIYLTQIHDIHDCDTFFDTSILQGYSITDTEATIELNRKMKNATYYELDKK